MATRRPGMSPTAVGKIRADLEATRPAEMEETPDRIGEGTRVFSYGKLRQDWNAGDDLSTRPQEWRLSPECTRVAKFRWDGGNQQIHVIFQRNGDGYVYRDVPFSVYRNMIRARSKGRFVNRVLNYYVYGKAVFDG